MTNELLGADKAVCALCKVGTDIKASHFMPKATYKVVGKSKSQSNSPILIRTQKKLASATDRQYVKPLLCGKCEQLFSIRECKLSKYWYRKSGFLLKDELEAISTYQRGTRQRFFSSYPNLTLDENDIYYFSISILWRALQGDWYDYKGLIGVEGISNELVEEIRIYLLEQGQAPSDIKIRVYVDWKNKVNELLVLPSSDGKTVQFVMLGLVFEFLIMQMSDNELIRIMNKSDQLVDLILDELRCEQVREYVRLAAIQTQGNIR